MPPTCMFQLWTCTLLQHHEHRRANDSKVICWQAAWSDLQQSDLLHSQPCLAWQSFYIQYSTVCMRQTALRVVPQA